MSQRVRDNKARGTAGAAPFTGATRAAGLDAESSAMIAFALRWLPYGGPRADDVLVEFGMSMPTFAQRIEEILVSGRPSDLSLADRNGIREMAAAVRRTSERR